MKITLDHNNMTANVKLRLDEMHDMRYMLLAAASDFLKSVDYYDTLRVEAEEECRDDDAISALRVREYFYDLYMKADNWKSDLDAKVDELTLTI